MTGICEHGMQSLSAMPSRIPMDGTFELTVRCNLHCKMCLFRHDDRENDRICKEELTAEEWISLADQAAEAGCMSLLLTGGEPMLRKDFCEIYQGIYQKGFLLTLYTNATLVTPEIMEVLKKYPPHRIGVTIYGASPESYEKVCGNASGYEQMLSGVKQLVTLPSLFEFRTTIIKDNAEDIDRIEQLIHKEFGAHYSLTQTRTVIKPVRGGCADVESCRLSPKDNFDLAYRRGIDKIKSIVGSSYDEKNLTLSYKTDSDNSGGSSRITLFGCSAGMSSFTLTWNGLLIGCQLMELPCPDAGKEGFLTAWNTFPSLVKPSSLHEDCRKCNHIHICNSCPASRYAETGDSGGKPCYMCEEADIINRLLEKEYTSYEI